MRRLSYVLVAVLLSACALPATVAPEPRSLTAPAMPVLPVDARRALGSSSAPLAIVEFADYQCPYCREFHVGTFAKLRSVYIDTGKVRYYYKDFPLRMHRQAFPASVAAYCAGAQGRFWDMQDLLYVNQARLGEALYVELAGRLEFDAPLFNSCRQSKAAQLAVRRDVEDGRRIRIAATPSFVLGRVDGDGVMVERLSVGAPTFDVFVRELDALSRQAGL